jgi:glycosyltransferase 2 family protein
VVIFVAIVVAIASSVFWMRSSGGHRLPTRWVRRLPGAAFLLKAIVEAPIGLLHDPTLIAETVTLESSVFALDALTLLLAFHALGNSAAIWIAFVSLRGILSLLGVAIGLLWRRRSCCTGAHVLAAHTVRPMACQA